MLGTLLTFALLALAAYYISRLEWVQAAGCSEGLLTGASLSSKEADEEPAPCFEDFSLVKSLLLAAIRECRVRVRVRVVGSS